MTALIKYLGIYVCINLCVVLFAYLSMYFDTPTSYIIFKENGIIETLTVLFYALCISVLYYYDRATSLRQYWYIYVLVLALGLRELDFDKRFTSIGILKSKFLFSDIASVNEKLIGAAILTALIIAIIIWTRNHFKDFYQGALKLKKAEWALGFGFSFIVISKSIDGIARKLNAFSLSIDLDTKEFFERYEETLELFIPLAFIMALVLYNKRRSNKALN